MDVTYERCCGIDVHKKTLTACVITPKAHETRTFSTMTKELLMLSDWLSEHKVTHVAMESTGVYWKPVYNLLEDDFAVMVVNARHIKAVPGRKTDVKDAEWIADLLRHGLMRSSFIPDRPQRELRELTRYRRSLIEERARVVNRIQKVLEGANIKLSSVATDTLGVSGRAILEAMVSGVDDPKELAELARGRLRNKLPALEESLKGLMGAHQRMMLQSQLRHLDFLDMEIETLNQEVSSRLSPFEEVIGRLDEAPGIGRRVAEEVLAEIGTDMSRFPSASHLASWAGLCPGNNESAGKRKSGRRRYGDTWLRKTLTEAAWAASRTKGTYPNSQYSRLAARRGAKRAIGAVAHSLIVAIYHMLRDGARYIELGANYFSQHERNYKVHRAVRQLEGLGYTVTLQAA
jgi:transposase